MKVVVKKNYEEMSKEVAEKIISYINNKPDSLLCFAGGDTPLKTYEYLVEANSENRVDFSNCKFVSLDEWGGLGRETKGSCVETLYNHLYTKISINIDEQVCFFDGLASDLEEECQRVNEFIFNNEKIDISLLGIGMNGHLGFNEPGVDEKLYSVVLPLDPITKTVGAKYFEDGVELTVGITLGLKHLLNANEVILIANGFKKASIVKETVEGEISNKVPSSLARKSENSYIFIDEEAGSKLAK